MPNTNQHLRAFVIKFHGPTCFRGARISIHDQRNNLRRYLSYDYAIGDLCDQAWAFLESKDIEPAFYCEMASRDLCILSENFTSHILGEKKEK